MPAPPGGTIAVTSGRNHLRDARKRNKRHTLEEVCHHGVFLNTLNSRVEKLRRAGHEKRNTVSLYTWLILKLAVVTVIVAVIVFDDTYVGHLLIKISQLCRLIALMQLQKLVQSVILAQLHLAAQVAHFGCENLFEPPVFGCFGAEACDFMHDYVRDFFAELDVALFYVFLALILASDFFVFTLLRHFKLSLRLRLFL